MMPCSASSAWRGASTQPQAALSWLSHVSTLPGSSCTRHADLRSMDLMLRALPSQDLKVHCAHAPQTRHQLIEV